MREETIDAVGSRIGDTVTYAGGGTAIVGGLTLTDWGVIVGMIGVIAGLFIQWYFRKRADDRAERELQARLHLRIEP